MTETTAFPSMGATLFAGLTGVALITHVPPVEYANPLETMPDLTMSEVTPDRVRSVSWAWVLDPLDPSVVRGRADLPAPELSDVEPQPIDDAVPRPAVSDVIARVESPAQGATDLQTERSAPPPVPAIAAPRQNAPDAYSLPGRDPTSAPASAEADDPATFTEQSGLSSPVLAVSRDATLSRAVPQAMPETAAGTLPKRPPQPRVARLTGDRVFLRSNPTRSSPPRAQFDTGTRAVIFERRGPWARVEIGGRIGWIFAAYLTPNTLE